MKTRTVAVTFDVALADDVDVVMLCTEQEAELVARYDGTDDAPTLTKPGIEFIVAREDDKLIGCVGLQPFEAGIGEVKRMYVRPGHRGNGLSRMLLAAVENLARARGYGAIRLETGDLQPEAMSLYASSGYRRIPLFGPYVGCARSLCYEKSLA